MARVLLGDVARERKEQCKVDRDRYPAVGLEHLVPQEVKLTEWSEGTENTFTKMFRKGDVLFGRRRAYLKKAAVASFDGICSGDITVIQAIPHKILPELLPFVIQNETFFDFAVGGSAGSLSPRVKWEHLRNYEFELPNEEKQRELAEVLWAIYDTLEAYKKLLVKTDELVKARFVEVFGEPLKNSMGWPTKKMKEIAPAVAYSGDIPLEDGKCWMLNLDMVEPTTGIIINKLMVSAEGIGTSTVKFSPKNILYSKLRPYLNKVVIPNNYGYATSEMIPLLPDTTYLEPLFLTMLLRGDSFLSFIEAHVSGTKMPRVQMEVFWNLDVILPPLDLQTQFAAFVHQTDKSKQELKQAITDLEATYKQILFDNLT